MANNVLKVNGIAIASIAKINGQTDSDLAKINGEEFTGVTDDHVLIEEQLDFSNQSTITFDELEQTTYNALMFQFINIHADTDGGALRFASTEADDYVNSTFWEMYHNEAGSSSGHEYRSADDTELNDNSAIAKIARTMGNAADEVASGYLWIYGLDNDHSLVKQWYSVFSTMDGDAYGYGQTAGGSILHDGSTTQAITGIEFTMASGTFDGTIKLFGLKEA